jgi:hypothetical protein
MFEKKKIFKKSIFGKMEKIIEKENIKIIFN